MEEEKNRWLELKERFGFSYGQLEKLTGIPKTTYQSWVYGHREPPEYVFALLQFYLSQTFLKI